jgi:glycosyltransferase involved in cell wall biosynthesis
MNYLVRYGLCPPVDITLKRGLFIFPNYGGMPLIKSKMITFVYDLSFIIVPEYVHPGNRIYLEKTVKKQIYKSDKIITISESSKKDIIGHYGIPSSKVSIIHPAVDHNKYFRRNDIEIEKVKRTYGIRGDYLLFVGNIEPRKNIAGIVNAYARLPKDLLKKNSLVIVGGPGWLNDEILQLIAKYQSDGYRIVFPRKFVETDNLPGLYSGASLFLFPSHYEGFGIPLLEAMACGTPILTSRNSSLPEVAQDAACYADPNTPETIAKQIAEILLDDGRKKSLVDNGFRRVRHFTWERSAREFHDLVMESI